MDNDAKVPQMMKAVFLRIFENIIGAKVDANNLTAPWIIAWYLGSIEILAFFDANCQKRTSFYHKISSKEPQ